MKPVLFFLLLTSSLSGFAQFRKKKIDFVEKNGVRIAKGDTILLGSGASQNGNFVHIVPKPGLLSVDMTGIGAAWANKKMIVDQIFESQVGINTGHYIHLNTGTPAKFTIADLELAIQKREIVSVNSKPFN